MDRLDLAEGARFINVTERRTNAVTIEALVTDWVLQRNRDELVEILQRNGVMCGPVLGLQEMLNNAQLQARGMLPALELPTGETIPDAIGLGLPIRFAEGPLGFDQAAPMLGAGNNEVYQQWLGLASGDMERFCKSGII
jgi:CoA:oxalate CoA-transferase